MIILNAHIYYLLNLNSATLLKKFIFKYLSNKKFLLVASGKAEQLRILSCQIIHLSMCCKSKYVSNPTDMAKVAIKSEKLSPFGGIFHVREQFSRFVGPVIDKVLGLRCTSYGYQSARLWVLCQVSTSVAATVWRNNGFGWNRLPKSFMGENTVFLLLTALIRKFYKYIMERLDAKKFGLKATSRIKAFVFKFISVLAKWIKKSRQYVLNIYSCNNAYANVFQNDF